MSGWDEARVRRAVIEAIVAIDSACDVASVRTTVLPGLVQAVPADLAVWRQVIPQPPVLLTFPDNAAAVVSERLFHEWDAARSLTIDMRGQDCLVHVTLARRDRAFTDVEAIMLARLTPFLRRRVHRLVVRPTVLSARERQVMDLVSQGLTGAAVAHRLGCRPRTVDKHLEHIYRKLGVSGRMTAVRTWSPVD